MYIAEIFVALSFFLGALVLWGPSIWTKISSYILLLFVLVFIWQFSLGYPRRIYLPPIGFPAGQVLSYKVSEPNFIYLWVLPKNFLFPISLSIPWGEKIAEELQKAKEAQKASGNPIFVNPNSKDLFSTLGSKKPSIFSSFLSWFGKSKKGKQGTPGQNNNPVFYSGTPSRLPPKTK